MTTRKISLNQVQIKLAFVATCIEATARTLGQTYKDVYVRLKHIGAIENYIYPHYGVLHTESRENVVQDIISLMNEWEAKA
ncbi:MAG: DUF3791 domain-containing protein [Bacteroidaceae bacterium]|nr:DUF3791 domain-containing protein [Bacteroidaceae bacterium]